MAVSRVVGVNDGDGNVASSSGNSSGSSLGKHSKAELAVLDTQMYIYIYVSHCRVYF